MENKQTHYEVHGMFWKEPLCDANYLKGKKSNLCHFSRAFSNADLYNTRQKALGYYQSLLDVLYEALGKCYTNDRQARIDLQAFLHAGCKSSVTRIGKMVFDDNLFNEIAVYWVHGSKKRLIHGISYQTQNVTFDESIATMGHNLIKERQHYECHNIPYSQEILCDMTDIGLGFEFVLPTPFDWDAFSNETLCHNLQLSDSAHF